MPALLDARPALAVQTDLLAALLELPPIAPAAPVVPPAPAPLPPLGDLLVTARVRVVRQVPPAPPKRKPVPTPMDVDVHVPVRRAREAEAPVVFRVRLADPTGAAPEDRDAYVGVTAEAPREFRQWGGTLWTPVADEDAGALLADPAALARAALPSHYCYTSSPRGEAEVRDRLTEWAARRLLIGDRFYEESGEPCWEVKYNSYMGGHDSVDLRLSTCARPGALLPEHYRADQRAHAEAAVRAYLDLPADVPLPRHGETIHEAADRRAAEAAAAAGAPPSAAAEDEDEREDERERARRARRVRWACRLWTDNLALEIVDPAAVTLQFTPSAALPLRGGVKLEGAYVSTSPDILPHSYERPGFTLPAPADAPPGTPRTRRLVPRVAWELVDDATGARTLLSDAEVEALGLRRDADRPHAARCTVERERH